MLFDTHPELLIRPYQNGVKLVKPSDKLTRLNSIGNIYSLPLVTYFVNHEADTFVDANYLTYLTNIPDNQGHYSDIDLKGCKLKKLFKCDTVKMCIDHNNQIMKNTKRMTIFEENAVRLDEIFFGAISFKFPLYNSDNKIIGIFGISALTDNNVYTEAEKLSTALEQIINTGLVKPANKYNQLLPGLKIDNVYLTKQEMNCLRLLITGKTFKLIGQALQLSPRTVEHYLENIKYKLKVKTKSELIEKVIEQVWPDILF